MKNRMKILFAYDGSECADAALDDLKWAGLPGNAQFIVLSVVESWLPPPSGVELFERVDKIQEFKVLAQRAAGRLQELNSGWEVKTEVLLGSPASLIIRKASEWNPDLIVMGSHGRTALGRFFFGSVSQKVLHGAHCSVRIARGRIKKQGIPARIIIGIDGSKYADGAVQEVISRNWPQGTEVFLVNGMWDIPPTVSDHMLTSIADCVAREKARAQEAIDSALTRLKSAGLNPLSLSKMKSRSNCSVAKPKAGEPTRSLWGRVASVGWSGF